MSTIKFIKEFLYLELPQNKNTDIAHKIQFMYFICWAGLIPFPILFILSLINEHLLDAMVFLAMSVYFVLNTYLIRTDKWKNYLFYVFHIILAIFLLYFYISGSGVPLNNFSIIVFPIMAVSFFGYKKGTNISFFYLGLIIIITFLPFSWNSLYNIDIIFKLRIILFYLAISLLCLGVSYFFGKGIGIHKEQINILNNELKTKDEFISKLSHQIRTPLNNIMVTSNLFSETKIDEQQKDLIETIMASTNNLVNVVNNISKVSAIDLGHQNVRILFNLQSTLNNTIKLFQSLNNNRVSINLKTPSVINYNLIGDPVKLKQIFLNIIENIVRNSSEQNIKINISYVTIKESEKNSEFSFKIETDFKLKINLAKIDTFGGYTETTYIENEDVQETYYYDFTIAQKIIENSGSQLFIDTPGNSTVFSFFLLFDISEVEIKTNEFIEPSSVDYNQNKVAQKSIDLKDANILLVEDNLINQKIVILSIQKLVKNIDVANNGKEALDKFGTSKYDLILMDIQMPVMDGIIATKKIRELESSTNQHTPIIAITANALAGDKENCLAAGMNDYISKPFQPETLINKMKSLVSRG
jgi:CheY-like chemotaxis protein